MEMNKVVIDFLDARRRSGGNLQISFNDLHKQLVGDFPDLAPDELKSVLVGLKAQDLVGIDFRYQPTNYWKIWRRIHTPFPA